MIPAEVKSVYLAGPMRNLPEYNFPAFHDAATELRVYPHNLKVVSPAEHDEDGGFNPKTDTLDTFNLFTAMKWDLHAVLDSDAVIVLPGWERSKGVAHELNAARAAGIPVYQYPDLTEVAIDPKTSVEERVVNAKTGGEKGRKLPQLGAVDPAALLEIAKVAGFGTIKYERYNFLKGYEWSLSFDALCRHLLLFWSGENLDDESGLPHMAHVGWHALTLLAFMDRHADFDDRPK